MNTVQEPEIELTPEPEIALEATDTEASTAPLAPIAPIALQQVLPADFPLPQLIKFIPNTQLRDAAQQATAYALDVKVDGPDGLQRADVALTALRGSLKAITDHFADPAEIANRLHKWITGTRGSWLETGEAAVRTIGTRIFTEQRRLDAVAAEERRKAQAEADRLAREQAQREADAAKKAQAPAPVVKELERQAATATAPPVHVPTSSPVLQGSSTVATWKARLVGTPAESEPNPKMAELSPAQRAQVIALMEGVISGADPITAFELNWSVLNGRAKADKGTLRITGIEAFESGGVRAKGRR
jgi:hypothetical protein